MFNVWNREVHYNLMNKKIFNSVSLFH